MAELELFQMVVAKLPQQIQAIIHLVSVLLATEVEHEAGLFTAT
jgi:hypothetical protein